MTTTSPQNTPGNMEVPTPFVAVGPLKQTYDIRFNWEQTTWVVLA